MADTPNSRKIALETAKEQRERVINEQALKEIELSNAQTARDRTRIQKELNKLIKEEASIRARIASYEDKSAAAAKSITESLQEQKALLEKKRGISSKINDLESKTSDLQQEILTSIENQTDNIDELQSKFKSLNKEIEEELKLINKAEESAKNFLSDVSSAISKVPLIGGALSKGFDTFLNSSKGKQLATKIASKLFDPAAIGKSQGNMALLGAGLALTGAGIKMGLAREQELKDQQRSIGLTNEQSKAVDRMQRGLLNSSSSMVTNLEEARKASAELTDNFGTYGSLNSTLVDQQVKLTKAFGLQAEEASDFQRSAMISGQTTEQAKLDVLATADGFNKTTKSTQSLSGVLRAVSKLSDSIRIQFRGSNQELTASVMKAKMLGTTLEDLNGIADQLLNIESSIENQVTAQLVTGRNINLDRARFFALTDDMNGLMDELVKQEIDYAAYSKMNRVEKQATAAALGMSTDQMAKFVSQQELATQLGIDMAAAENQTAVGLEQSLKNNQERISQMAKAGNLAAKQYERDNEALTRQEKMTAAVEQMSKIFQLMAPIVVGIGLAMTTMAIAALVGASALTAGVAGAIALGAGTAAMAFFQGMVSGGDVVGGKGPVVVGENGPEIVHLRKGNSVTPNSQLNTVGNNNKETNDLLRQLITKIEQPAIIKMGDTTINELGNKINLNRNYQVST
jgi:chromosome segregation ATPase